jgi:hypothetical protein
VIIDDSRQTLGDPTIDTDVAGLPLAEGIDHWVGQVWRTPGYGIKQVVFDRRLRYQPDQC